jgi:hypothetical protein
MLRGLLHAIPTDPSLLHNNLSEISKIVVAKNKRNVMNIIKELTGGMDVIWCLNALISNVFILVSFRVVIYRRLVKVVFSLLDTRQYSKV